MAKVGGRTACEAPRATSTSAIVVSRRNGARDGGCEADVSLSADSSSSRNRLRDVEGIFLCRRTWPNAKFVVRVHRDSLVNSWTVRQGPRAQTCSMRFPHANSSCEFSQNYSATQIGIF